MPPNTDLDIEMSSDHGYELEEEITPLELFRRMRLAWQNELCSPKLLAHQQEIVETVHGEITQVDQSIEVNGEQNLMESIKLVEVNRAYYMVNCYLRLRVAKIEADPVNVLREHQERRAEGKPDLLTEHEEEYATSLHQANSQLLNDAFLASLPDNQRTIPVVSAESHKKKLGRQRVFVEVLDDGVNEVTMPDMIDPLTDVVMELQKESRHFIPLKSVEKYVEGGQVRLL